MRHILSGKRERAYLMILNASSHKESIMYMHKIYIHIYMSGYFIPEALNNRG